MTTALVFHKSCELLGLEFGDVVKMFGAYTREILALYAFYKRPGTVDRFDLMRFLYADKSDCAMG